MIRKEWYETAVYAVDGLIGSLTSDVFRATSCQPEEGFVSFVICLDASKFVLLCVFTLIETICPKICYKSQGSRAEKVHFRLTCVAQKRRRLNSLIWKVENVQKSATIVSHDDA